MTRLIKILIAILLLCQLFACASTAQPAGVGGSTAAFTISKGHLYLLNGSVLEAYRLTPRLEQVSEVALSWDVETLFPHQDYLFVGTQTGIHILDIRQPAKPKPLSIIAHLRSCDPVVVDGNTAYATLRRSGLCNRGDNALLVLDVSKPHEPRQMYRYRMTRPYGLGIDGGHLYVCDAEHLKKYKIQPDKKIKFLQRIPIVCDDLIAHQGLLTTTGRVGVFQFNDKENKLKKLSEMLTGGRPISNPR